MAASYVCRRPWWDGDNPQMTDDSQRRESAVSHLNRRRVLAGAGVLLTGAGSLVAVSEPASAAVSVGNFDVANREFTGEQIQPVVDVTAAYQYDVGSQPVNALEFTLSIDGSVVASDELITDRTTLANETILSGRVTDSDAWGSDDFAPAVASSVSRDIKITLSFSVVESDGREIAGDSATATATVTVNHPQETEWTATVGGEGVIRTPTG